MDPKSASVLEPDELGGERRSRRKSKKGKGKGDAESRVEDAEDKLLNEYQQQIEQEDEKTLKTGIGTEEDSVSQHVTLNNDVGKKKKKKLKSVAAESEMGSVHLSTQNSLVFLYSFLSFSFIKFCSSRNQDEGSDQDADVENETESKGKKKKKKKKHSNI